MATYNEQLQRVWHDYEKKHARAPSTPRDVVGWGVANGSLVAPKFDPLAQLAEDMARALREEYRTDRTGRRYRVNHAVRITRDGVQTTLWAEMATAPREHMFKAFAQRRNQIVGDCLQLKTDVDAFNSIHAEDEPIQMVLDFTQDVEELQGLE